MADNKKYYWLKLKKDFFKRHDIQIIEAMPNGKDYILFYLKMLVESVDHEGNLRFNDTIPYNETMLATITNTNIDVVRTAMKVFVELKMIDLLEDRTIFMIEVEKMLGTETYWAEQKRKQRLARQCPTNVQLLSNMSNQEIDKEIKIELENKFSSDSKEYRLSLYLFNWIKKNNENSKQPNFQNWAKTFDLILRIDERKLEEVKQIVKWCQEDEFWYKNILNPTSLRKHYDKFVLEINKPIFSKRSGKLDTWTTGSEREFDSTLEDQLLGISKDPTEQQIIDSKKKMQELRNKSKCLNID